MLTIFLTHRLLTGCIILFLLLSIICQVISGVIYQNMISQSDNMSAVKNETLRQCKKRYANYYKLNGKMANTAVFVDKFLQGLSFARLSLTRWGRLSGQLMMLSLLFAGISIYVCLREGSSFFEIIPYYFICILELYLYFSVTGLIDLPAKQNTLKINLMDYLENHYAPRLEIEREVSLEEGIKKREIYGKELIPAKKENELITPESPAEWEKEEAVAAGSEEVVIDGEHMEELESLLKEFFA